MTAPSSPRPDTRPALPPPVELTVEPPDDSSDGRFTVVLQPFAHGEAAVYLAALAGQADSPAGWEQEQCRRLAARIKRWEVQSDGRPVPVTPAAVARLPAWAFPQLEAALFGEPGVSPPEGG